MAKTKGGTGKIDARVCTKCGETKPVTEFSAKVAKCRTCVASYNASPAGRESRRRYAKSEAGCEAQRKADLRYAAANIKTRREQGRRYAASETGRETRHLYRTGKAGRTIRKESSWWRAGVRNADGSRFTVADFDRLLANQGGRCAVPGCPVEHAGGKTLHVDHEHRDGKIGPVRGLVCNSHNVTAARVGDGAA